MSELPNSWQSVPLSELTVKITKGSTPTSYDRPYVDSGVNFIKTESITESGVIDKITAFIDGETHEFLSRSQLQTGDHLFSMAGTIGRVASILESHIPANTNQALGIIRPKPDVFADRFLFYALKSPQVQWAAGNSKVGVGRANISLKDIGAFEIPLPPLPEQRRIVARIEELFSRLDAGVAALRHAKAQLQRYRESVLEAAVTGQLTQAWREKHPDLESAEELLRRILEQRREQWNGRGKYTEAVSAEPLSLALPATWTITNIDSVISGIEAGKNFKCEERPPTEDETGLVKISAVTWGNFDELESKTVTRGDQIREEHVIHSGDFLLSRANTLELVGAPVIVDQITRHLMLSDKVLRLRFIERLERFALIWLRSKLGRKEIESRATGNQLSMRNIAQASLRAIPLPLPPLAEQHQIVAEVEARTTAIDHLEAELDRQITRSNRLRQSTLAAAFAGKFSKS